MALERDEARWLLVAFRAGVHRRLGFANFAQYAERTLGYKPRATEERLRLAKALEHLPAMAEAPRNGTFTWTAIRELSRVATRDTESAWLDAAQGRTVREVEALVSGHRQGAMRYHVVSPTMLDSGSGTIGGPPSPNIVPRSNHRAGLIPAWALPGCRLPQRLADRSGALGLSTASFGVGQDARRRADGDLRAVAQAPWEHPGPLSSESGRTRSGGSACGEGLGGDQPARARSLGESGGSSYASAGVYIVREGVPPHFEGHPVGRQR